MVQGYGCTMTLLQRYAHQRASLRSDASSATTQVSTQKLNVLLVTVKASPDFLYFQQSQGELLDSSGYQPDVFAHGTLSCGHSYRHEAMTPVLLFSPSLLRDIFHNLLGERVLAEIQGAVTL